jgi:hypothetical protein
MIRALVVVAVLLLAVPSMATIINEGVVVYSTETQLSTKPITEDSFKYHPESKSDIKEKSLVTINITPYLSSGKKLDRKIDEKELPLEQAVTNLVEHVNNGVKKTKLVQIYPETALEISDDAETIKQSSPNGGKLKHEIYYGYQKSIKEPWSQYYKAENCNAVMCKVVRAEYATRVVTVTNVPLIEINKIVGMPAYEVLP